MALTILDVKKLAQLSRLALTAEEEQKSLAELNSIFDMIAKMQAVNTDGIEPLSHPIEMPQRLREDVVVEGNNRDAYQQISPAVEQGLFLVPKVIE